MNTPEHHIEPELLSAYLDDEVSTDERQLIETHLPTCVACQHELDSLRFTMALVQALPPRPIPRPFYVTEEMVAPQAKAQQAGWWGWLRGLAPFGAALAALLVVLVISRPLMVGMGGSAAMPAATPQASEAQIALASTEAPAEAPAEAADSATLAEEEMETRQGDVAATAPAADTGAVMEQPASPTSESAIQDSTNSTNNFSITAPIVGTGGESNEGADIPADDSVTSAEAVPTENAETMDKDTSQITPAAMNTILIFTVILVVVAIGTLVVFARQRP